MLLSEVQYTIDDIRLVIYVCYSQDVVSNVGLELGVETGTGFRRRS
jgi:hypothetical protein